MSLAACGKKELPTYEEQGYVFGTLVEVSIYGVDNDKARKAVASVMQEFQRLHDLLHAWKPSAVSDLNISLAKGESREVTPELAVMLKDAAQLSRQSDGLFNPAIGGLVKLGGFHAKGYALDRAAELLKQQGIFNALINIGGNVMALGLHGDRSWRIGIQHPRKPGPIATLELHDGEAVGTSGDYQRYFELSGKRYCHLIDPRNGQPVQGVHAVTILTHGARAGTLSDAPSKPLFIAGSQGWRNAAQKMNLTEALLIDSNNVVHLTPLMQKRLEFMDQATIKKIEP